MSEATVGSVRRASARWRRRVQVAAATLLLVGGATTVATIASPGTVSAATTAIDQCNNDNTGAAREIACDVTVLNTLDLATGVTSSIVTTRVCTGPPASTLCVTTPGAMSTDIVGSVTQCNGSATAGGSIVTCNVSIVNNITGVGSTEPPTVNQCIGSGQGGGPAPTTNCAPTASATGADVTQCNGSANNGGASERVTCTVLPSTVSDLWPVTVNQCNGSATGGGDLVICTALITTNIIAPQAATPTTVAGGAATTAVPGTETTTPVGGSGGAAAPTPSGAAGAGGGAGAGAGVPTATNPGGAPVARLPETGGTTNGLLLAMLLTGAGVSALLLARRRTA